MKVGTRPIKQSDHRHVDVPDLVGPRCTDPDFGLGRMNTSSRAPPLVPADESVPGRRRGEYSAKALSQQRKRSRWNVPVLIRRDHLLDRFGLRRRQLLWRRARTGRHVVETAFTLALPSVVSRVRHSKDTEHRSQWQDRTGSVDRTQQHLLAGAIRQSSLVERESRHPQQDEGKSEQRTEHRDAPLQPEHFLLQPNRIHVDDIDRDHWSACRCQPTASCRARYSVSSCVFHVARRADEIAKAMVVPPHMTSLVLHDSSIDRGENATTSARVRQP